MTRLISKGILLISLGLLPGYIFSQDYNFRNFNEDEGLGQPYIYSIIQDDAGYLWVGTGNGLSRYNGITFETFTTADSLADNFITTGLNDGNYLWFGHMNGQITCFNGKKFLPVRLNLKDSGPVTHFAKNPDGTLWLSTSLRGIMQIDTLNGAGPLTLAEGHPLITTFEFVDSKVLLAGTNAGLMLLYLDEAGKIKQQRTLEEIPKSRVTCIRRMRQRSGFYISTENDGIFVLTRDNDLIRVRKLIEDQDFDYTGVQDVIEDSKSDLWISTLSNGLLKLSLSQSGKLLKISSLNVANGFVTDNIKTVFEDSEGNIWSGNYGKGLTRITSRIFSEVKFNVELYGEIHSICPAGRYLWIGTRKGLVRTDTLSGNVTMVYNGRNGFRDDVVTALFWSGRTGLWIGTENSGLFRLDTLKGKILKFPLGDDALENSITSITGTVDKVCAGTRKGLITINMPGNDVRWFTINKGGLPHNYINSLFTDSKGRIWVTTHSNTISYIENDSIKRLPVNTGAGVLSLGRMTEDINSRIWVASAGDGLFLIASDTIVNLTVKDGLLSDYCYSLICEDGKYIWIGHKGGLSRLRISDFSVKPYQHIEATPETYQFNTSAFAGGKHQRIWFASNKNLILYDPARETPSVKAPVLRITSLRINDELKEFSKRIILPPGFYRIRIDYLAVSLKEPDLISYQYRLDGYEQWSEVTRKTSITYNHLTEGDYTFILKASGGNGVVTEKPLTISFIIRQPVWKKWWFYIFDLSLLFIITMVYIRRREQKFLLANRILEEKVQERTHEIQSQKNEIEIQRDLIDEKNNNIMASIKYAGKIQNAIMTPLELVDRFLPDNFILSIPKDIVSGDFYWLAEKDGKIVFVVADCTGHGVPGAFMSLLGITLLNDIVNIQGIIRSDTIVTKLKEGVINSLHQRHKEISTFDGMDISLCVLDTELGKIQFTGGINDMLYIRDGEMVIVKADRASVSLIPDTKVPFTVTEIECRKGDVFYLFSDGYQDQFGGDYDKKYLRQHFFLTLREIHKLPMPRQREILENKLKEWIGENVQTDDITVMGIRF